MSSDMPSESNALQRAVVPVLAITVAMGSFLYAIWCFHDRNVLSTDSWTYFELSRSLGKDFYRISTFRWFGWTIPYSGAYPPVWPCLLRVTQSALGPTIKAGIVLNFVVFAGFGCFAEWVGRRVWRLSWIGLVSATVILGFWYFLAEMLRGAAMAFTLLLILLNLYVFVRYAGRSWMPLLLGFTAGIGVMSRFDFLASAIVLIALVGIFERTWKASAWMIMGFVATVSPWVTYSWIRFHSVFVTDANGTALSIDPHVDGNDFYTVPPVSALQDPAAWVRKLLHFLPDLVFSVLQALSLPIMPMLLLIALFFFYWRQRGREPNKIPLDSGRTWRRSENFRLIAYSLVIVAPWPAYVATGWAGASRYFSSFAWFVTFASLVFLGTAVVQGELLKSQAKRLLTFTAGLLVIALVNTATFTAVSNALPAYPDPDRLDPVLACLQKSGADRTDTVIVIGDRAAGDHLAAPEIYIIAAELGARTGWQTAFQPSNWEKLTETDVAEFANRFRIRLAYVPDTRWLSKLDGKAEASPVAGCSVPLYHFRALLASKNS